MSWSSFLVDLKNGLSTELFRIGDTPINGVTLIVVALIVIATLLTSRGLRRGVTIALRRRKVGEGSINALTRLLHYLVLFVGIGVALHTAGINLAALFAAGAVLAIGIGFAMQNIVQNFVSGIILLGERVIKPGDVLRVDDRVVKVEKLGIRSTQVKTRDGEHVIVPNSNLVQSSVTNYTLEDTVCRLWVDVGVVYGADLREVFQTLRDTAEKFRPQVPGRPSSVVLSQFGSSSVDFQVGIWFDDPWMWRQLRSDLSEAVWWALKERNITIAFPQLDIHFDPLVSDALAARGAAVTSPQPRA